MVLVSFLGCCAGLSNQRKALVFFYAILVTGIFALQVAAAAVMLQYAGLITEQSTLLSSQMLNSDSIELNNAILSSYTACCSGCPPAANCNNAQPYFANITAANCDNQTVTCALVQPCNSTVTANCYIFSNNAIVRTPPVNIAVQECDMLSKLYQNGIALVGPASTGACGGGNLESYQETMASYFRDRVYWVGATFAGIAAVQGLLVVSAFYVLCFVPYSN